MHVRCLPLMALAFVAQFSAQGAPGLITVTTDPPGPVAAGQNVRLTFRMTDYTDPAEIDGFRFRVAFPPELFSFVPGSVLTGTSSGQDQQWLTKANQESAGAESQLALATDASTEGFVDFHLRDVIPGATERGTVATQGFLLSFAMSTHGEGTGLIHPRPYPGAQGPQVLFAVDGSPAGVSSFSATFKTVEARAVLAISGTLTNVTVSWPTNLPNYVLQQKAMLDPALTWSDVVTAPSIVGDRYQLSFPLQNGNRFWRLRGP